MSRSIYPSGGFSFHWPLRLQSGTLILSQQCALLKDVSAQAMVSVESRRFSGNQVRKEAGGQAGNHVVTRPRVTHSGAICSSLAAEITRDGWTVGFRRLHVSKQQQQSRQQQQQQLASTVWWKAGYESEKGGIVHKLFVFGLGYGGNWNFQQHTDRKKIEQIIIIF